MVKYSRKPLSINAELFKVGMEDGYDIFMECLGVGIRGVKMVRKPFILVDDNKTPVQDGEHYVIANDDGSRSVVNKVDFEREYERVEEECNYEI